MAVTNTSELAIESADRTYLFLSYDVSKKTKKVRPYLMVVTNMVFAMFIDGFVRVDRSNRWHMPRGAIRHKYLLYVHFPVLRGFHFEHTLSPRLQQRK